MVDWEEIARQKRADEQRAERHEQKREQRTIALSQALPEFTKELFDKVAAQIEPFNAKQPTAGMRIEIERSGENCIQLARYSPPTALLRVTVQQQRDTGTIECLVSGNAFDGHAETETKSYTVGLTGIGFVIRDAIGRPCTVDHVVITAMRPFVYYLS